MKMKTISLKHKKRDNIDELDKRLLILMLTLFAAGVIIGSGTINLYDSNIITNMITTYIKPDLLDIKQLFIGSLTVKSVLLLIIINTGLSCIGTTITMLIPMFIGMLYGVFLTFLIESFKAMGYGYFILIELLPSVIFILVIIISSIQSVKMSKTLLRAVTTKIQYDKETLFLYLKSYIIPLALIFASVIIEIILRELFLQLFKF